MLKQPLKQFSSLHQRNYFIDVYPQTKTYVTADTDKHVKGALTLEAQPIDAGMTIIHDCGDTQRHLTDILPRNVKSDPKSFMNNFRVNRPRLYHEMKSLYRVSLGPKGFFVIVTPQEMEADEHGITQDSKRIADLVHFILELYFVHDYK